MGEDSKRDIVEVKEAAPAEETIDEMAGDVTIDAASDAAGPRPDEAEPSDDELIGVAPEAAAGQAAAADDAPEAEPAAAGPRWRLRSPASPAPDAGAEVATGSGPAWLLPVAAGDSMPMRRAGVWTANRILAAVIVVALILVAADIFATIRSAGEGLDRQLPAGGLSAAGQDGPAAGGTPSLKPVSNYLELFGGRPIVRNLDNAWDETNGIEVIRVPAPNWKKVARESLDLIGFAPAADGQQEAIVADRMMGRTLFLLEGQTFKVGDHEFELVQIQSDHVVLEKDGDNVTVK